MNKTEYSWVVKIRNSSDTVLRPGFTSLATLLLEGSIVAIILPPVLLFLFNYSPSINRQLIHQL